MGPTSGMMWKWPHRGYLVTCDDKDPFGGLEVPCGPHMDATWMPNCSPMITWPNVMGQTSNNHNFQSRSCIEVNFISSETSQRVEHYGEVKL